MASKIKTLFVGLSAISLSVQAQEQAVAPLVQNPPIMMETVVGDRAISYQMIVNKKLQSIPKLGFFSVTNFQAEWNSTQVHDYMLQGKLTYTVAKNLDVTAGFIWNPIDGIRPSAGIMYTFANPTWLVVINPRVDLSDNANADLLALAEYKPRLTDELNLYTRIQGLYTHNLKGGHHTRSYIMLRAGIAVKDINFGLAGNFDFYGSVKHNENNFGGFVVVNLF